MPLPTDGPPTGSEKLTERRVAPITPLDVDGLRTTAVGTALWGLAFLMLLPFAGHLRESGDLWVLWTCLAGFGGGLLGWDYCRRRRNRRRAAEARAAEQP
ncbi:MAG TPA: DUF2530 domain-containing protein [Marmoricola sp.]|nr:DUF2530 domain-containing protein [Marmoricola sp.]